MLLKLQLLKVFVDGKGLAHEFETLGGYVTEVDFLDVRVGVACFQNSEEAIVS